MSQKKKNEPTSAKELEKAQLSGVQGGKRPVVSVDPADKRGLTRDSLDQVRGGKRISASVESADKRAEAPPPHVETDRPPTL